MFTTRIIMYGSYWLYLLSSVALGSLMLQIQAVDIAEMQKYVQANSANITARIGDHLGWNDNLKKYYQAFMSQMFSQSSS